MGAGFLLFVVFGVVGVSAVAGAVLLFRARRMVVGSGPPVCGQCGYNLTGSESNRCPECGKLFIEAGVYRGATPAHESARKRLGWAFISLPLLLILLLTGGLLIALATARRARLQAQVAAAQAATAAQQARAQQQFTRGLLEKAEGRSDESGEAAPAKAGAERSDEGN
ncbi:MAG: hypothetical protein HUU22_10015 [Phycisphaerae bacterium]|nr:hypothetical protein [Phycisphaerae bacterium]NUQ46357.1 hypothetical protein [Phycisphaerae bacterium]